MSNKNFFGQHLVNTLQKQPIDSLDVPNTIGSKPLIISLMNDSSTRNIV
jgi:hypothetical protein